MLVPGHARAGLPNRLGVDLAAAPRARPQAGALPAAGRRFIPGPLRNVALRRDVGVAAGRRRRPVAGVGAALVELRAPHRGVIGGGGNPAHRQAVRGGGAGGRIATRRPIVAGGDQGGDALRRRLLPQVVPKAVFRRPQVGFAHPKAGVHHRSDIMVHRVQGGQVHPVGGGGAAGDHQIDVRQRRHRPRPLHIQRGFGLVVVVRHPRIGAREHGGGQLVGQDGGQKQLPERGHVAAVHVRAPHHRNALARAVEMVAIQRVEVVDVGQVARHHRMHQHAAAGEGEAGAGLAQLRARFPPPADNVPGGGFAHIVERNHPRHHRRQRRRNRRILGVGPVQRPAHAVAVDGGVQRRRHLPGAAGKLDHPPPRRHLLHLEAGTHQPGLHRRHIGRGRAIALAKLLGGEPMVVLGRVALAQLAQLLLQGKFLLRAAPQRQQHMLQRQRGGRGALVIAGLRLGQAIAPQAHPAGVVDGAHHPRRRLRRHHPAQQTAHHDRRSPPKHGS